MKRRKFLKGSVYGGTSASLLGVGATSNLLLTSDVLAAAGESGRVLNNVMLLGGADLRHLFAPPPPSEYGAIYWDRRETIHASNPESYNPQAIWDNEYLHVTAGDLQFGINAKAGWLHEQFIAGNVAVVCNVKGSDNQRHDHSQLIMNSGDPNARNFDYDQSGWGGRLVEYIGIVNANIVSFASNLSVFTNGKTNGSNIESRSKNTISAPDMRNVALTERPLADEIPSTDPKIVAVGVLARSLKAYYAKRGVELTGPELKIIQHEMKLRQFGGAVATVLGSVVEPVSLSELKRGGVSQLHHYYLGNQLASLYDAHQVNAADPSILNFRVSSLEYHHWDTHKNQKQVFEENIYDLFGIDRGLDRFYRALDPADLDNQVFVFTSDFGRQLRSNGTGGTDHGKGSYTIIIGNGVRGGVYGEMFPQSEITPDTSDNGRIPYDKPGMYIEGLTSFQHVLGEACDWVAGAGAGNFVFTGREYNTEIEKDNFGNDIEIKNLFSAQGYSISGSVKDELGFELPNVTVTVKALDGSGTVWTTLTDAAGLFIQGDLQNGDYEVEVKKSSYTLTALTVSIFMGNIVRDFVGQLLPGAITGQITNTAGDAVAGIEVRDALISSEYKVVTDAQGRFLLVGYSAGQDVLLTVSGGSSYVVTPENESFVHDGGISTGHNYIAIPNVGTISGKVTDTYGNPVAGIELWDANIYPENVVATTDVNGNYLMEGFTAGQSVFITGSIANGFSLSPLSFLTPYSLRLVHDGSAMTGHDFFATVKTGSVSGRIITPDGEPVIGRAIGMYNTRIQDWTDFVITNTNGEYTLGGAYVGDNVYILPSETTDPGEFSLPVGFSATPILHTVLHDGGIMTGYDFSFEQSGVKQTISGQISDGSGSGVADVRMDIWDKKLGKVITSATSDAIGSYAVSLADGVYLMALQSTDTVAFSPVEGNHELTVAGAPVVKDFVASAIVHTISGMVNTHKAVAGYIS